ARRVEPLGYATLLSADHFTPRWFEPGPVLTAAALATSTLRVACTVFDNDFRHPALLAKEAASIDVLPVGASSSASGRAGTSLNTTRPACHSTRPHCASADWKRPCRS